MTSIANDTGWSETTPSVWDRLIWRLRVVIRHNEMARAKQAALRQMRQETRDPRWLADIGVDATQVGAYDSVRPLARALGAPMEK